MEGCTSARKVLHLQLWFRQAAMLPLDAARRRICGGQELSIDAVYQEGLVERLNPGLPRSSQMSLQHTHMFASSVILCSTG